MNDITENKIDNDFDDLLESLIEPENKVQLATIGKSHVKETSTNPVEEYKYSGIELYPSVFKEIMLKLYLGKQFTRQEAIEETKKYHISHGGVCNKTNYVSAFKKGISALQSEGYSLDNPAYGCWKLKTNNECAEAEKTIKDIRAKSEEKMCNPDLKELIDNVSKLPAEKIAAINNFIKVIM